MDNNDYSSEILNNTLADEKEYLSEEEFIADHQVEPDLAKYLTIGALIACTYGEPHMTLSLMGERDEYIYELENVWDINDKEKALETINWLLIDGHTERNQKDYDTLMELGFEEYQKEMGEEALFSAEDFENYRSAADGIIDILELSDEAVRHCESLLAWDLDRVGFLARAAFHAGYISTEEAWAFLKDAARIAQDFFNTWEEYIVSLIIGRSFSHNTSQLIFIAAYTLLFDDDFLEEHPISSL